VNVEVLGWFAEKPKARTCESIKGILEDGKYVMELDAEADVKDAALIAAAQEAEHFEIASYGTLRTWATVPGKHVGDGPGEKRSHADHRRRERSGQGRSLVSRGHDGLDARPEIVAHAMPAGSARNQTPSQFSALSPFSERFATSPAVAA
jgi:hypothetical protein